MDKAKRIAAEQDEFIVIPPDPPTRESNVLRVAHPPPEAQPCTPSAARVLCERGHIVDGHIAPNGDGFGGYMVWLRGVHPGATTWYCLTHEDGAPLRFPDAVTAHRKAVDCHLGAGSVSVRWPPE